MNNKLDVRCRPRAPVSLSLSLSLSHGTPSCGGTVGFTHITRALTRQHTKSRPRQVQTRDRGSVKFSDLLANTLHASGYTARPGKCTVHTYSVRTRDVLSDMARSSLSLSLSLYLSFLASSLPALATRMRHSRCPDTYFFQATPGGMGSPAVTIEQQKLLPFLPLSPATTFSRLSFVFLCVASRGTRPPFFNLRILRSLSLALRCRCAPRERGTMLRARGFRAAFGDICYFRQDPPAPGAIMKVLIKKCLQSVSTTTPVRLRPGFPD